MRSINLNKVDPKLITTIGRPEATAAVAIVREAGYTAGMDDSRAAEIIWHACLAVAMLPAALDRQAVARGSSKDANDSRKRVHRRMQRLLEELEDEREAVERSRTKLEITAEDPDLAHLDVTIQDLRVAASSLGGLLEQRGSALVGQGGNHRPIEAEFVRRMRDAWSKITGQRQTRAGKQLASFAAAVWPVYFGEPDHEDFVGWLERRFQIVP